MDFVNLLVRPFGLLEALRSQSALPYITLVSTTISRIVRFKVLAAASISETSVNFYQTTRRNNPEDSHLLVSIIVQHDV
jgi:hypothetical protein